MRRRKDDLAPFESRWKRRGLFGRARRRALPWKAISLAVVLSAIGVVLADADARGWLLALWPAKGTPERPAVETAATVHAAPASAAAHRAGVDSLTLPAEPPGTR